MTAVKAGAGSPAYTERPDDAITRMRRLLVEDDPLSGDGWAGGRAQAGFEFDWVRDGMSALQAPDTSSYAAAILGVATRPKGKPG